MVQGTPTIVWALEQQVPLMRRLAEVCRLTVVGAGCPVVTAGGAVASALGVATAQDLRAAIAQATAGSLVLIGAPGSFGSGTGGAGGAGGLGGAGSGARVDAEELDNALARGVRVVSFEPLPASLQQWSSVGTVVASGMGAIGAVGGVIGGGSSARSGAWCEYAPVLRRAMVIADLLDLRPSVGVLRSVHIGVTGPRWAGSLGARLFDAVDLMHLLAGVPVSVFASYAGWSGTSTGTEASERDASGYSAALHILPGQSLRDLHGDIAIAARMPGGQAVSLRASNTSGRFEVDVRIIGSAGSIVVRDGRLTWFDAQGRAGEDATEGEHAGTPRAGEGGRGQGRDGALSVADLATDLDFFVDVTARQIERYLSGGVAEVREIDLARVLATAQAALLSCRTGEPESPTTMMKLGGA
jgi:hypothetical protein